MQAITSKDIRAALAKGEAITGSVQKAVYGYESSAKPNVLRFVFSSDSVDRAGDIVVPKGIDTKGYVAKNPVVLLHHDAHQWAIGRTQDLELTAHQLIGSIEFFTDLDEDGIGAKARAAVELVKRGVMGVSISFLPVEFELNMSDGVTFQKSEILEISLCNLPCNPDCYHIPDPSPSDVVAMAAPEVVLAEDRQRKAAWRSRMIALAD